MTSTLDAAPVSHPGLSDPSKSTPLPDATCSFAATIENSTIYLLTLDTQWPTDGWDQPPPPYIVSGDKAQFSRGGSGSADASVSYRFASGTVQYVLSTSVNVPLVGNNSCNASVAPSAPTLRVDISGSTSGWSPSPVFTLSEKTAQDEDELVARDAIVLEPGDDHEFPANTAYELRVRNESLDTAGVLHCDFLDFGGGDDREEIFHPPVNSTKTYRMQYWTHRMRAVNRGPTTLALWPRAIAASILPARAAAADPTRSLPVATS